MTGISTLPVPEEMLASAREQLNSETDAAPRSQTTKQAQLSCFLFGSVIFKSRPAFRLIRPHVGISFATLIISLPLKM